MNWNLVITAIIAVWITQRFIRAVIRTGIFTGNRYMRINGEIHVKHPGGEWEPLKEHMRQQKRLRDNR